MKRYAKTPTIYQIEATECGAASLAMIFAYFKKYISLEEMRIETGVSRDGCNAGNIMRAAKRNGLDCHGYLKEAKDLRNLQPPCILHWEYKHFVVFEGYKGKCAYINDPSSGRRKVCEEELEQCFTGIVLTFKPTDTFRESKKQNRIIHCIKGRLAGQNPSIVKIVTSSVFSAVSVLLFAFFIQSLLDGVFEDKAIKLLSGLLAVVVFRAGLGIYQNYIQSNLYKKIVLRSSHKFLHKLFRLPFEFYEQRYAAELVEIADVNSRTDEFLANDLFYVMGYSVEACIYAGVLTWINPVLTLAVLGFVILNFVSVKVFERLIFTAVPKWKQDCGKLAGIVYAGLRRMETIQTAGAETVYAERLLLQNEKINLTEKRLRRYRGGADAVSMVLKNLMRVVLFVVGAMVVFDNQISVGQLVAYHFIVEYFMELMKRTCCFFQKFQNAKVELQRAEDIMCHKQAEACQEKRKKRTTKLEGAVELRNVSFGYSRLRPSVITNINVRIGCGASVAFVGTTGCGKSTIAKLIGGLYEPWSGNVYFDGVAAERIPGGILSASIAMVSREQILFAGSIRDNITMWNSGISETDMITAAMDACIHEDIMKKTEGYDFWLAEEASNLSGGQRQRLKIARALVTNPTVLILDEATSALDVLLEKKILDNIKRRGCTCVVIAHRLSAIRNCDRIMVLDDGRVVQQGKHEVLLEEEGIYKTLVDSL